MVISQGEIWWPYLPAPTGSGPGFRRPVVVVQSDALNQSRISTGICVPLTSNLKWALAPGNVSLSARLTGLPKDSVANVSRIISLDEVDRFHRNYNQNRFWSAAGKCHQLLHCIRPESILACASYDLLSLPFSGNRCLASLSWSDLPSHNHWLCR